VQDALANLMRGRTSFVIAHRLSTIQRADVIIVLERGRVAEIGRHEELIAKPDGVYAALHAMQSASAAARPPTEKDGRMIKSMTGFSSVSQEDDRASIGVTVRSVNHRYLDVQMRLPQSLSQIESRLLRAACRRGPRGAHRSGRVGADAAGADAEGPSSTRRSRRRSPRR